MKTISATELARHTREVLDDVAARGETVVVERNQTVVARIVPAHRTMTAQEALADLGGLLTPAQAKSWYQDSRGEFDEGLRDPWA